MVINPSSFIHPATEAPTELSQAHCQSKFYTACSRTTAGWNSTVFAHKLSPRSAGFDAENRLYLFALTVPLSLLPTCKTRKH
jgi:hypothetical protein